MHMLFAPKVKYKVVSEIKVLRVKWLMLGVEGLFLFTHDAPKVVSKR